MEGWKEKSLPRESSVWASFTLFQMGPTGVTHPAYRLHVRLRFNRACSVNTVEEKLIPERNQCMDQMSENLVKYQFACSILFFKCSSALQKQPTCMCASVSSAVSLTRCSGFTAVGLAGHPGQKQSC